MAEAQLQTVQVEVEDLHIIAVPLDRHQKEARAGPAGPILAAEVAAEHMLTASAETADQVCA